MGMSKEPDPQQNSTENHVNSPHPLVVEYQGKRSLVVALAELEGALTDATRPKSERKLTIKPAIQAIQALESRGIRVGIITEESFRGALNYQHDLGATGPIICENGVVIVFPPEFSSKQQEEIKLEKYTSLWLLL